MTVLRIGLLSKKRGNFEIQEKFAGRGSVVDRSDAEVSHHELALAEAGYLVRRIQWGCNFIHDLRESQVDLVFNVSSMVEAAILEDLAMPYAGSSTAAIAAATDKALAKRLWKAAGLPTSPFHVARSERDCALFEHHPPFDFPLFVKPAAGRGSAGIDPTSIVENYRQLVQEVERRHQAIGQPVIIEPFLQGREITLGILGNDATARILPPLEIVLPKEHATVTYTVKQTMDYAALLCPAPLNAAETLMMEHLALQAYHALGFADYGRIDTILTEQGPFLLEGNTFAGLMYDPGDTPNSYMSFMACAEGLRGRDLLDEIVRAAVLRLGIRW
jgi:D-alanine-D-alanine ligase